MPTITTRIQRLLKRTDRMKQQAVKGLLQTLKHIERERKQRTADLEEAAKAVLNQLRELGHAAAGGSNNGRARRGAARMSGAKRTSTGVKKRRIRRGPEELKAEATKVLETIRKAGKDGIGGNEIRKSFPGVGPDIKGFVEKHGGGKVKTTGQRSKMRYHPA
jgi:hypothetical protein